MLKMNLMLAASTVSIAAPIAPNGGIGSARRSLPTAQLTN